MKKLSCALILAMSGAVAAAECENPDAPELPDGAKASMEEMIAGQKAVKAFQEANIEYMNCLKEVFTAAEALVKEGKAKTAEEIAEAQKTYEENVEAFNAAVSVEESVAGQFNTEIREFKAANPG